MLTETAKLMVKKMAMVKAVWTRERSMELR